MAICAAAAPVVSAFFFVHFVRASSLQATTGLFQEIDDPFDRKAVPVKLPSSLHRLTAGLSLYAFAFALYSCRTTTSEHPFTSGPQVQAIASIVLALVMVAAVHLLNENRGPYVLYRSVPLLFGGGFILFLLLPPAHSFVAGLLVMLGYLLFEALSFNDYCNASKTNDRSLLRSMVVVRLSGSSGIFVGWAGRFLLELCDGFSATLTTGLGLFAIITASSLAFTDKAADALSTIANQRAQQEAAEARPDKMAFIAPFANAHGLSKRETEVLTCLIQGRTMQYTAEKLFIAESTARTHVHKIYQKTESQGRMELLDCFEQFCAEQDGSRTGGRRR